MASSNRTHNHPLSRTTMLNNHTQTQAHSVSHVLRKHTNIAPKPSKDYRRATIAHGYLTTKDTSARAPRIEKSVHYPRSQNRSNADNLVQQFDDALDATHDGLARWADATLIATEERCNAELDKIVHHFDDQIQIMAKIDNIVVESFGGQILQFSRQQDGTSAEQVVEVTLAECMQELADTVTQERENLEALGQQWLDVQANIIGLAVEILGKHNIEFEQHGLPDATEKSINDANLKNKETEKKYDESEQSVNMFEVDVDALYIDTTKMVKAQQKAWRVERKKMLDNIKQVMATFEKNNK